ncbi:MAG: polysaccharide deacetylase family protein [Desertimonas sp.]
MTRGVVPEVPAAVRVFGTPPLSTCARFVTRRRLRVIGYHDVPDADVFAAHVRHLVRHYTPVDGEAVAAWVRDGASLPDRAVWVTFDDGYRSVVDVAMPLLTAANVPATAFVCPGPVTQGSFHWWDRLPPDISAADRRALVEVDDRERRRRVSGFEACAPPPAGRWALASVADLHRWVDAGHQLGNHSWDHPSLDRCRPDEQRSQIARTTEWLDGEFGPASRPFAYPHGHVTVEAQTELARRGSSLAVGYDHRLAGAGDRWALSRLRIAGDDPVWRLEAALAGLQPVALAAAQGLLTMTRHRLAGLGDARLRLPMIG